jgi:hypothetical protein
MTLNDLIGEIRHYKPDWTPRYMIQQINISRAVLLKNRLNQGVLINDVVKQVLQNVEMDIASGSELDSFDSSSKILKSRKPIPSLIARHNKPAFLSVRNPNIISEEYNVIPKENAIYAGSGRYNKRGVFTFLYDGHIYIKLNRTNPKLGLIDTLSVEGVFENPLEVITFNNPDLVGRDFWWEEYPINAADWAYVKAMILGNEATEAQN